MLNLSILRIFTRAFPTDAIVQNTIKPSERIIVLKNITTKIVYTADGDASSLIKCRMSSFTKLSAA